jgi:thiamine pyrophosphokinase
MSKYLLILNGFNEGMHSKTLFSQYDYIICCDGGYNTLKEKYSSIEPNLIIGDFDSIINKEELKNFPENKIIFKNNQDETDAEFALKYILKNYSNISCIDFIYSISLDRIDHTLCNILLLKQIPLDINSKIITLNQEIYLIRNKIEFLNKKNKTVSIIPLTFVENIKTNGLKWELNNVNLQFGFIGGISNIIEKDNASICLNKGECVVILKIN